MTTTLAALQHLDTFGTALGVGQFRVRQDGKSPGFKGGSGNLRVSAATEACPDQQKPVRSKLIRQALRY